MPRIYRWEQTVTYTVTMKDEGETDEETGETLTTEVLNESAQMWMESSMPIEYYPEEFVTVDQGPVEFLGMEVKP